MKTVNSLERFTLKIDTVSIRISHDGDRLNPIRERTSLVKLSASLVKDESRGITSITYDALGNPLRISYSDGSSTQNVYSASGEKLKTTHTTAVNGKVTGQTTTEYRGNIIYRDGKVDTVLFPGG